MSGGSSGQPAPGGANTPAPGGLGAGPAVATTPSGGHGPAIVLTRGTTSRKRLKIDWDYPVWKPTPVQTTGDTVARTLRKALGLEEAFATVRNNDLRPLLVLRECNTCSGTEDALLSRMGGNDRTFLLSYWFHCVKLPPHVLESDHPFHNLFAGDSPPHLFMADCEGKNLIPLTGAQSRSELWEAMEQTLKREYKRDPRRALREIDKLLARYDHLDGMEMQHKEKLDEAIEKHGPNARRVHKLRAELSSIEKERKAVESREKAARDLGLLRTPPKPD